MPYTLHLITACIVPDNHRQMISEANLKAKVKILIGGAPTSQEWADECGADGWGKDAVEAVRLALELNKQPREVWA